MYEDYWGLKEKPFENTPNPKFLYLSPQHEEVFSRLLYVVGEGKGAAMLTGIYGCGKTLLARTLLKELGEDVYKTSFINNPNLNPKELLIHIVHGLAGSNIFSGSAEIYTNTVIEKMHEILVNNMQDGKKTVVIVDEAHMIKDFDVWEQLRLLLNFQMEDKFLLTLLLVGQPELKNSIDSNKQFSQRIAVKSNLGALTEEEVKQYIIHRLTVAGKPENVFSDDACQEIFKKTGGIPRRINHICDFALLSGAGAGVKEIDRNIVSDLSSDLVG